MDWIIILESGWRTSGKSKFMEFFKECVTNKQSDSTVDIYHFAEEVKNEAKTEHPFLTKEHLYGDRKQEILFDHPVIIKDASAKHLFGCVMKECSFSIITSSISPNDFLEKKELICIEKDKDNEQVLIETYIVNDFVFQEKNEIRKQCYWNPRAIMIYIGMTKRLIDPDCWVKKTLKKITDDGEEDYIKFLNEKKKKRRYILIDDWRFENELNQVLDWISNKKIFYKDDATISLFKVRINRFIEHPHNSTDPSERSLDNFKGFDCIIDNTKTLDYFYEQIHIFFSNIKKD